MKVNNRSQKSEGGNQMSEGRNRKAERLRIRNWEFRIRKLEKIGKEKDFGTMNLRNDER
jgi:hypothetical protein